MVQCCGYQCPQSWFHLDCVQLPDIPDGDWYCSNTCQDRGDYIYCSCKTRRGFPEDNEMLRCELGDDCRHHEKYHRACMQGGAILGNLLIGPASIYYSISMFLNKYRMRKLHIWHNTNNDWTVLVHTIFYMFSIITTEDTWYCSEECRLEEEQDDHVLAHSLALLWRGLNHLANRDAIRAGDGPAMLSTWRLDMLEFWQRRHPKYLILGHFLLASKLAT